MTKFVYRQTGGGEREKHTENQRLHDRDGREGAEWKSVTTNTVSDERVMGGRCYPLRFKREEK